MRRPHLTTGSHGNCAEMPKSHRSRLTTGGRGSGAEMPLDQRPRLILVPPQGRRNANQCSLQWEGSQRPCSNAAQPSPFPTIQQGVKHIAQKCHPSITPTLQQGAIPKLQKCQRVTAPTLFGAAQHSQRCHSTGAPTTRGHSSNTEMSATLRLA
jgi:hypothetical protein